MKDVVHFTKHFRPLKCDKFFILLQVWHAHHLTELFFFNVGQFLRSGRSAERRNCRIIIKKFEVPIQVNHLLD